MSPDLHRDTSRDTHRPPPGWARPALLLAMAVEALLFASLLSPAIARYAPLWLFVHALAGCLGALAACRLLPAPDAASRRRWFLLCACLNVALPLAGVLGTGIALMGGVRAARLRQHEQHYWQFTDNPALPFTTPAARGQRAFDGRGLCEQLAFSADGPAVYRKVLAAGRMRNALSVDALRAAVAHPEERIRLTAYQTLDRKSSQLNDEIDRLSAQAVQRHGRERADTWLQVASNYWELLTLEQSEPVARKQLLAQARAAALQAVLAWPRSRNAHFTLGRIALRQGDATRAEVAFARAQALGMPASTTLPYRAEAAFAQRDFGRVKELLDGIGEAFKAYPPLRQVVDQWR